MSIFLAIAATFLVGYCIAIALQLLFGYLIGRMGRNALMHGDSMKGIFFMLSAVGWLLSAGVGSFSSFALAPYGKTGAWTLVAVEALALTAVLLRSHGKAPHQRPASAVALFTCCILGGCIAGGLLRTAVL